MQENNAVRKIIIALLLSTIMIFSSAILVDVSGSDSDMDMLNAKEPAPPIKIVGISNKSNVIQDALETKTSSVSNIPEVSSNTIEVGKDIILVDEMGLATANYKNVKKNVQDLILKGVPVILVSSSNKFLKDSVQADKNTLYPSGSNISSSNIYGLVAKVS